MVRTSTDFVAVLELPVGKEKLKPSIFVVCSLPIVMNMCCCCCGRTSLILLLVGVHEFNFYLDGEWKCDQKLPWSKDHNGCPRNLINVRQVLLLLLLLFLLLILLLLLLLLLLMRMMRMLLLLIFCVSFMMMVMLFLLLWNKDHNSCLYNLINVRRVR